MKNIKKAQGRIVSLEAAEGTHINVNVFDQELGLKGSYNLQHTHHSLQRSKQRGISNFTIALVVEYGKCFYKQGLQFHVMCDKNIPKWVDNSGQRNAQNTVVVLHDGDEIVTCYRGCNVMKHINRKQKYLAAA